MCDVATLAGAALTAGSVAANSAAASQVAGARAGALCQERQRQAALDAEARGVNERSRKLYDDFGGQQAARAKSLDNYFTKGTGQPPANTGAASTAPAETMPASSSGLVVQEQAKQGAKAQAYSDQQGAALGELRSFGDVLGDTNRAQARNAGTIGQLNSFKAGSSAVLPYELEAANTKGAGLKGFADVLAGVGGLGMRVGLSRNELLDPNVPVPSAPGSPPTTGTIDRFGRALPALPPESPLGAIGNLFKLY